MLPVDFIDTARHLISEASTEADLRSSVSRAYYGALHCCLDALPQEFVPASRAKYKAGSHLAVVTAVRTWGRSMRGGRENARKVAHSLDRLRRRRMAADYHLAQPFVVDAKANVSDAKTIAKLAVVARRQYDRASRSPAVFRDRIVAFRETGS
jgi:hypothetical protein